VEFNFLLEKAREAAKAAYAPYSNFHVGAAVLAGGKLYTGCNVENASYGLTICAERVALFNAIADGQTKLEAIAVACVDAHDSDPPESRMPCGACRQVLAEFSDRSSTVHVDGVGQCTVADLLPQPFALPRTR
jgi:cytidine deaminase